MLSSFAAACLLAVSAPPAPPLPVGPRAPIQPCDPPRPHFSWDRIPTSYHGARKDAVFADDEVARLAKYQVMAVEKWYTPCGAQGPTQSGPDCAVETKVKKLLLRFALGDLAFTTTFYFICCPLRVKGRRCPGEHGPCWSTSALPPPPA